MLAETVQPLSEAEFDHKQAAESRVQANGFTWSRYCKSDTAKLVIWITATIILFLVIGIFHDFANATIVISLWTIISVTIVTMNYFIHLNAISKETETITADAPPPELHSPRRKSVVDTLIHAARRAANAFKGGIQFALHNRINESERKFAESIDTHREDVQRKSIEQQTLEELRAGKEILLKFAGDHANVSYVDQKVLTRSGVEIPIRIFNNQLPDNSPVLIYYPGCAFIFDLFEINSRIASRIAFHAKIKVILVQFRLAPENSMPTSIQDGLDAAKHIIANARDFGIDTNSVFLGGWGSGAQCATVVSSYNDFKVLHQVLLGGTYDLTESTHDYDAYEKEDRIFNRELLRHIANKHYNISHASFRKNSFWSPLFETEINRLPPTTILAGEFDAFRNDSEAYYQKLQKGGIKTQKIILPGQTHQTVALRGALTEGPDPAEVMAQVITNILSSN